MSDCNCIGQRPGARGLDTLGAGPQDAAVLGATSTGKQILTGTVAGILAYLGASFIESAFSRRKKR